MRRCLERWTRTLCLAGVLAANGCADPVAPPLSRATNEHAVVPDVNVPSSVEQMSSGEAAATAVRATAARWAAEGHPRLQKYLDTSRAWNVNKQDLFKMELGRARSAAALRSIGPSVMRRPNLDISGTGTPPEILQESYFPKPVIVSSSTSAAINEQAAVFLTTQTFVGGTNGQSVMAWSAKNTTGSVLFPSTESVYSAIADGIARCVSDIMGRSVAPVCLLVGTVSGQQTLTLDVSCGVTVTARANHTAWLTLPLPLITVSGSAGGPNVNWNMAFPQRRVSNADPVANAESSESSAACPPPPPTGGSGEPVSPPPPSPAPETPPFNPAPPISWPSGDNCYEVETYWGLEIRCDTQTFASPSSDLPLATRTPATVNPPRRNAPHDKLHRAKAAAPSGAMIK